MSRNKVHDVYRKSNYIAEDLRSQIVNRVYGPGDRLPTRDKLVIQYDVSKVTVQRALKSLMDDGLAEARVGRGTIVSLASPHLTKYALLFPKGEESSLGNQLWTAFVNEAKNLPEEAKIELHYGFDGREGNERYQELLNDVENRRIAGLMFASHPYLLENTPILDQPGIPRSVIMTPQAAWNFPVVTFDGESIRQKFVKKVSELKCKRVAIISSDSDDSGSLSELLKCFEQKGIKINPDWIHGLSYDKSFWVKSLTRLLMAGPAGQRPDCLLVLNDNLLPNVSQALTELNLIPPRDLQLISHCNFPWPTFSAVPVTRVGYCITECLQAMMKQINDQQNKKNPQKIITLPAYFESEYPHKINTPEKKNEN